MRAILLTLGMYLVACGGEFLQVGSKTARGAGLPYIPEYLPPILVAIGAAFIIESAFRTPA